MCLSSQQRGAKQQAGGSGYDFSPSFAYVREVFNNADCVIGNLETSLSHSWPYATEQRNIGGMPNCNGPKQYLGALKFAGFDALVLANNHCCDAGVQGIIETTQAVEEYGFPYTGLFREKDAQRFVILDVKGIKVGLLSYAEFYNSKDKTVREAGCEYMINTYSKERIAEDIAAARAAGAELIVAYNHWGAEHTHQPTPKVVTHAQEMADAGVDIIIGSHSPCGSARCLAHGGGRTAGALCIFNGQLCVQHGQKHRERHFYCGNRHRSRGGKCARGKREISSLPRVPAA